MKPSSRRNGQFARTLGPWSAGALVAGCMIGTGIFFFVSEVAQRLGSPAAILSVWVVGAAIATCGALSLAELAAAYPETGGEYVFLRRAYGPAVGFLFSWSEALMMRVGSLAIMAIAFGQFVCDFLEIAPAVASSARIAFAILAVVSLTGVNIWGVRLGSGVQNVFTIAKVFCLVVVIAVGVAFAAGWLTARPVAIVEAPVAEGAFLLMFATALIPVMWTLGGWDESPFVAEEVRDPERNLPWSILGGLWLVAGLFVLVNGAYLLVLTPGELAGSGQSTATLVMERALGGVGRRVLSVALMISAFGAVNGMILTGGRIIYATGRDQALFRWFARLHPRTGTPARSLVAQGALTIAAMVILANPFSLLLYTGLAYWGFAALTTASVFVLRAADPDRPRPFRVWAYPVLPVVFIVAAGGMGASVVINSPRHGMATLAIVAVGLVAYWIQSVWLTGGGGDGAQAGDGGGGDQAGGGPAPRRKSDLSS